MHVLPNPWLSLSVGPLIVPGAAISHMGNGQLRVVLKETEFVFDINDLHKINRHYDRKHVHDIDRTHVLLEQLELETGIADRDKALGIGSIDIGNGELVVLG